MRLAKPCRAVTHALATSPPLTGRLPAARRREVVAVPIVLLGGGDRTCPPVVLGRGGRLQVGRVHAGAVTTQVIQLEALRYWPDHLFVNPAMGQVYPSALAASAVGLGAVALGGSA